MLLLSYAAITSSSSNWSFLAERGCLRELFTGCRHIGALALEIIIDGAPQARVKDVVRRVCCRWHVATGDLMLALRTRLHPRKLLLDGILNGLIIAELEVQKRVMLDCSPMAAK